MNPEELRVLIRYHARMLAKWVQEPDLMPRSGLTAHAERVRELINKLPEED